MYYVYVLLSEKDNRFYTGFTANLDSRLKKHFGGKVLSTKKRLPLKLVYLKVLSVKMMLFIEKSI